MACCGEAYAAADRLPIMAGPHCAYFRVSTCVTGPIWSAVLMALMARGCVSGRVAVFGGACYAVPICRSGRLINFTKRKAAGDWDCGTGGHPGSPVSHSPIGSVIAHTGVSGKGRPFRGRCRVTRHLVFWVSNVGGSHFGSSGRVIDCTRAGQTHTRPLSRLTARTFALAPDFH